MFAKTSLILTLLVSLLFVTQAQPVAQPVEMQAGGSCAAMACTGGCCTNKACCQATGERQSRQPQSPAPRHQIDLQLSPLLLRFCTIFLLPPAPRHSPVISDETSTAHSVPPLVASCIWLT